MFTKILAKILRKGYYSIYDLERPVPKEKKQKKSIDLGEKIIKEFVRLRGKTYTYPVDDGSEIKVASGTKYLSKKENLNLGAYKKFLDAKQLENRIIYLKQNTIHAIVLI